MTTKQKIDAVVDALKLLKQQKIKMSQRELRDQLNFASTIMTAGYKLARENKVI